MTQVSQQHSYSLNLASCNIGFFHWKGNFRLKENMTKQLMMFIEEGFADGFKKEAAILYFKRSYTMF